jgi:hypothetical protein
MSEFPEVRRVTHTEVSNVLGSIPYYVSDIIDNYGLAHRPLTPRETESAVLKLVQTVCSESLPLSGPARHPTWEEGWAENLRAFDVSKSGPELAEPRYYNKSPIVRWHGELYRIESDNYEYNMLKSLQYFIFYKYFRDVNDIFEFGCGTGHNLFRVADVNPAARLHGFDWAESAVKFVNLMYQHKKIGAQASQFNFFDPPSGAHLPEKSGVYTVAALEQVGENFGPWINYILRQKPRIVVHIEPIAEVLKPRENLLDDLCIRYMEKRNYLKGYLPYLKKLEREGHIKIHDVIRTRVGSLFIEGYTIVTWSCL